MTDAEAVLLKHESITGVTTAEVAAMLLRFATSWARARFAESLPCVVCGEKVRLGRDLRVSQDEVWCRACWTALDVPW